MKVINIYNRYVIPVFVICIITCYVFCCYIKSPVTTVILVRHAERTDTVDQLNAQGMIRAQELARVLDDANISAIFASTANRTQQTAAQLASQIGVNTTIYNANDLPSLVNDIESNYKGKVILVVGHSNTVPQTINLLGIQPVLQNIPHNEYDNLYIATLSAKSDPHLLKLEYGADSP